MGKRAAKAPVVGSEGETKPSAPKAEKDSVTVEFRGQTRTFSKAVHGPDYADLADEFAEKHKGTIL